MTTIKRSVTVRLGALAIDALGGGVESGAGSAPGDLVRAIRLYLNDRSGEEPGWTYPRFLRDRNAGKGIELELSVEDSLWSSMEEEAERQGVTVAQLLEHAALYYAAELDAGRVTERMLEDGAED